MTMTTDETLERLLGAGHLIKRIETKGGVAPIATVEALSRAEQAVSEAATLIRSLRDERDAAREAIDKYRGAVSTCLTEGGMFDTTDPNNTVWWQALIVAQQFASRVHPPHDSYAAALQSPEAKT